MRFETGKTYSTRSIGDYNCIISATIISRTEKTLVCTVRGVPSRFRIKQYEGIEQFKPWGNYSMCPIISADKQAA